MTEIAVSLPAIRRPDLSEARLRRRYAADKGVLAAFDKAHRLPE